MKRTFLISLSVIVIVGIAQSKDAKKALDLAYVHVQTSRAADTSEGLVGGDMAPNLVVRLYGSGREILAHSGDYGSVVIPLRAGKYCGQLFFEDGRPVTLESNEENCFSVSKGERLEVGLVAAYNPNVRILPPPRKLK